MNQMIFSTLVHDVFVASVSSPDACVPFVLHEFAVVCCIGGVDSYSKATQGCSRLALELAPALQGEMEAVTVAVKVGGVQNGQ
jgi:hypothetical protein